MGHHRGQAYRQGPEAGPRNPGKGTWGGWGKMAFVKRWFKPLRRQSTEAAALMGNQGPSL